MCIEYNKSVISLELINYSTYLSENNIVGLYLYFTQKYFCKVSDVPLWVLKMEKYNSAQPHWMMDIP